MSSTYLTRTFSAGNRRTYTFSAWVKRSDITSTYQYLFDCNNGSSQSENPINLNSNKFTFAIWNSDTSSSAFTVTTNRLLRDTNAWYHLVCAVDTTQATASNRIKLYINGVQETSLATANYPSQNYDTAINTANVHSIGRWQGGGGRYFGGLMSHIHFCDGTQYAASDFGEEDSQSGEWKIKTSPSVTYGTNGFFILKDGNSVTDQSGEGNNFTASGNLTNTEDCPSDVFATMNVLDNQNQASTFTMGNTKIQFHTNNKTNYANFAINKGKFYWEMKYADTTGGSDAMIGVAKEESRDPSDWLGHDSNGWSYYAANGKKYNTTSSTYGNTWTTNNIIGVAFDADTRTIWFSKDGTWQNSATISEIGAGTTTNAAFTGIGSAGDWFYPAISGYNGNKVEFNFGNGYFGTTAISSEGTNASNIGKFEYDVPTNFTALSLKGINS